MRTLHRTALSAAVLLVCAHPATAQIPVEGVKRVDPLPRTQPRCEPGDEQSDGCAALRALDELAGAVAAADTAALRRLLPPRGVVYRVGVSMGTRQVRSWSLSPGYLVGALAHPASRRVIWARSTGIMAFQCDSIIRSEVPMANWNTGAVEMRRRDGRWVLTTLGSGPFGPVERLASTLQRAARERPADVRELDPAEVSYPRCGMSSSLAPPPGRWAGAAAARGGGWKRMRALAARG